MLARVFQDLGGWKLKSPPEYGIMDLTKPKHHTRREHTLMQDQYTTNTPPNQDAPETLYDVSPTGKVRPWRLHRLESEQLAEAFWTISARMPDQSQAVAYALRGDRVSACATGAVFEVHKDRDLQYLTLTHANFCRDRLCPMCQWRRSLKMGAQARAVVDECDRVKMSRDGVGYRWMLLTLTQANVDGPDLSPEVDRIHAAFKQLTRDPRWKAACKGWLRVTEVTHNIKRKSKAFDTFHPHLHILIATTHRYFKSKDYLSKDAWIDLWAHYIDQEAPSIDIHIIKPRGPEEDLQDPKAQSESLGKAVAEVSKYAAKPGSYLVPGDLDLTAATVATLSTALHGRRLAAWGGVCKTAAHALKLDSLEAGDLVHIDETSSASNPTAEAVSRYIEYNWAIGIRNYTASRTWEAPASWAAAVQREQAHRETLPKIRANQIADMQAAQDKIHRMQKAVGEKIANRAIKTHDGYQIRTIMEIADHVEKPKE